MNLEERPISADVDLEITAVRTDGMSGAEIKHFVEAAADKAFLRSVSHGGSVGPILPSDLI